MGARSMDLTLVPPGSYTPQCNGQVPCSVATAHCPLSFHYPLSTAYPQLTANPLPTCSAPIPLSTLHPGSPACLPCLVNPIILVLTSYEHLPSSFPYPTFSLASVPRWSDTPILISGIVYWVTPITRTLSSQLLSQIERPGILRQRLLPAGTPQNPNPTVARDQHGHQHPVRLNLHFVIRSRRPFPNSDSHPWNFPRRLTS